MPYWRLIYCAVVLLIGGSGLLSLTLPAEHALIFIFSSQFILAVFTFPTGCVGSAILFTLIYLGMATPAEAIALSLPVSLIAGYLQWFKILPAIYRKPKSL
jgi:hypothetical protein